MNKKQKKRVLIFSLLAFAVIIVLYSVGIFEKDTQEGVSILLYDKEGNEIQPRRPLAIVGGTPGVAYIRLQTTTLNTGVETLSCQIDSLTTSGGNGDTTIFADGMTQCSGFPCTDDVRVIPTSTTSSWTTDLINADTIAHASSYTFRADVECFSDIGQGPQSVGTDFDTLTIAINSDGTPQGTYTVEVLLTGEDLSYCGDGCCDDGTGIVGTCTSPFSDLDEDEFNCPADCYVGGDYVDFRTSDLSYLSGGVAYTSSCGSSLTQYGYTSVGSDSGASGSCPTISGETLLLSGLPGQMGYSGTTGVICLYEVNADTTRVNVRQYRTTLSKWLTAKYDSDDSDKTDVESQAEEVDPAREVSCV